MNTSYNLNGDWRLVCDDGREFPARVPGDVHLDLMRAGVIPDPNIRMNFKECRWIGDHTWSWHRDFPASPAPGKKFELVFDGLAYVAEIFVNGTLAGKHKTMHRPCRLDVSKLLKDGENHLEVRLAPFDPSEADVPLITCPLTGWADAISKPEVCPKRGAGRKAEYTYGWDWAQGLPVCGIWRGCRLECNDFARVCNPYFRTTNEGAVNFTFQLDSVLRNVADAHCTLTIRRNGAVVAEKSEEIVLGCGVWNYEIETSVSSPEHWFPLGYGAQPLYDAELTVTADCGSLTQKFRFAFRTVEVEQKVVSEHQEIFRFRINGKSIFAKGGNWIPSDIIPGRITDGLVRQLVSLAADAGINYLRIWGGGCYEQALFYDLCDEYGIMVWQDFMFSGSEIPDFLPEFHQECMLECETTLKRLRNHPSIIMWCGSNETDGFYESGCKRKRPERYGGWRLLHVDFPEVVAKFCPGTPYLASCPSFGLLHKDPNTPGHGTYHGNFMSHQYASDAEFDAEPSIPAFDNELYGVSGDAEANWSRYLDTGKDLDSWDNPFFQAHHVLDLQRNNEWSQFFNYLSFDAWGRRFEQPLPHLLDYYAVAHAELVKRYMEVFLRRLDVAGGAVFWMYNNAFPMMGWAMVDYYGTPKDAWYAMKRVCNPRQPVAAIYDDRVDFYLANTTSDDVRGTLTGKICRFDGTVLAEVHTGATVEAGFSPRLAVQKLNTVSGFVPEECFVLVSWEDAAGKCVRNHRFFAAPRARRIPNTEITVKPHPSKAKTWILESPRFAAKVTLAPRDAENFPDDSCFDLYPGIPHEVSFRTPVAKPEVKWDNSPDRLPYVCGLVQNGSSWTVSVYNPRPETAVIPLAVKAENCALLIPEKVSAEAEATVSFTAVIQPDVFQNYPFCLPVDLKVGEAVIRTACAALRPVCMNKGVLTLANTSGETLNYPSVQYRGVRCDGSVFEKHFDSVVVKPGSETILNFEPPADLLPYTATLNDGRGHAFSFWENAVPFEELRERMKLDSGAALAIDVLPFAGDEPNPVLEGRGRFFRAGENGVTRLIPDRNLEAEAELFFFYRGKMLYVDVFTQKIPFCQQFQGENVWRGTCVELLLGYTDNSVYRDYSLALTPGGPEVFLRRGTKPFEPGLRGDSCKLQALANPDEKLAWYRLCIDTEREGMPELLTGKAFCTGLVLRGLDCDGIQIFNGIGYMEGCVNAATAKLK